MQVRGFLEMPFRKVGLRGQVMYNRYVVYDFVHDSYFALVEVFHVISFQ